VTTDCHVHIVPIHLHKPELIRLLKKDGATFARWEACCSSSTAFLNYLDAAQIDRCVLVSTVAPEVDGISQRDMNCFVTEYAKANPRRLIASGGIHPSTGMDVQAEVEQLLRMGARMIKIHPPHQHIFPNGYLNGCKELEALYRTAEANGIPVMFHTGTSAFPGARSKFGDPINIDDVAVDFPDLKIILAHGGRPLWVETAFFMVRRHRNVFMDISGIPPKHMLTYFPRLESIADKVLFGTDWPSLGVREMQLNLAAFNDLRLSSETKDAILSKNALKLWPL
jgi:predicted TIM-barrel fold metal-dependent hydrolase